MTDTTQATNGRRLARLAWGRLWQAHVAHGHPVDHRPTGQALRRRGEQAHRVATAEHPGAQPVDLPLGPPAHVGPEMGVGEQDSDGSTPNY